MSLVPRRGRPPGKTPDLEVFAFIATLAIVINGKVKSSGRVLSKGQIKALIAAEKP